MFIEMQQSQTHFFICKLGQKGQNNLQAIAFADLWKNPQSPWRSHIGLPREGAPDVWAFTCKEKP